MRNQPVIVSAKQFSNLFSSYTQAYNKMCNRKGSLFLKNFKRKQIKDEGYFIRLINYIHYNLVEHGFVKKPADWKFSSFNAVVSKKKTTVKRDVILEWSKELFQSSELWERLKNSK